MKMRSVIPLAIFLAAAPVLAGCAAGVGAAAGGAAGYEYSNKRALDQLDADYKAGKISKQEYLHRRQEIEKRSAVQ